MHIVHIASEIAPAAKIGGLGDVIRGLSRELMAAGHTVDVIIPKYNCIDYTKVEDLHIVQRDLWSFLGGEWCHNTVWKGTVCQVPVYFIEAHNQTRFYGRPGLYGYPDDIERFTYFARASLEFLLKADINPDILHLHEWQAALAAPLYWDIYHPLGLDNPAVVFTIHNLEHQGHCRPSDLDRVGLTGDDYLVTDKLQHDANPYIINLVKGAIIYSNQVTTVSPTYAEEVKGPQHGFDLQHTLTQYDYKFSGILNGLDYSHWSPAVDPHLPVTFDSASFDGKEEAKHQLRRRLMLAEDDRPIAASICRLVPQKGVDLIRHAIFETVSRGGQFVLLGSSPIKSIQEDFYRLKLHFSDSPHVHIELNQNEELVHLIYAGSDCFLVPSLFEPCGLTQLISLSYGTVPIVRQTGGLADTIFDIDHSNLPPAQRNGYTFEEPNTNGLNSALHRALECYHSDPHKWRQIALNGMDMDYSWKKPAQEYIDVYHRAREAIGKNEKVTT